MSVLNSHSPAHCFAIPRQDDFTRLYTQLASSVDIGFEPVACAHMPYWLIFLAKATSPYVLILTVGGGIPLYLKWSKERALKKGKDISKMEMFDESISLKMRLIGSLARRDSAEHFLASGTRTYALQICTAI